MPRDADCIFCKIVSVDVPAQVIHEDESSLCFLDVNPLAEGHLLVVPHDHYPTLVDTPPEVLSRMTALLPHLGRALLQVTGAPAFNVLVNNGAEAGQVVPHVHLHLIPRFADDGLGYRWHTGTYRQMTPEDMAGALQAALARGH